MEWELIDETEPAAGVELYYFDGEQCAGAYTPLPKKTKKHR
jgi:hypothetical protein